jgi:predicted GH43/DUF377 family glycosyl hydrolase
MKNSSIRSIFAALFASAVFITGNQCGTFSNDSWMLGPFEKVDAVNPILHSRNDTTFWCPVWNDLVHWEIKDVFNPTAVVKDGRIYMLYRAEDEIGSALGTSRIGMAISDDGFNFFRYPVPIFYPDNDDENIYEWDGGCEDPRIVMDSNGTYFMTYTAYNGTLARLFVASSTNLFSWTKHGSIFKNFQNGALIDLWSKSGSVVSERIGDSFVAYKIDGKYWMYFGESNIYLAWSTDLINWTPVGEPNEESEFGYELTPIFGPRDGYFDSDIVEPGPQAVVTPGGILLIYNSRNKVPGEGGHPELPRGTYSAGQILFDIQNPTVVLNRTENYFMKPEKPYEIVGQVNNVVFLEGLVTFKSQWFLYYGTADSKIAVAVAPAT